MAMLTQAALLCFGVLDMVLSLPYYIAGQTSSISGNSLCGGDSLASIYTPQQNELAKALCRDATSSSSSSSSGCWIGLYTEQSNGNSGPWRWTDSNVESNFYDFQHSNPSDDAHDCVILNTTSATETFWDDVDCGSENPSNRWVVCNNNTEPTADLATADYYHIYSMGGQQQIQSSQVLETNYVLGAVNTTHVGFGIQLFPGVGDDPAYDRTVWQLEVASTNSTTGGTFYIKCVHCSVQQQYLALEKTGANVVLVSDRVPTAEWRISRGPHRAMLITADANDQHLGLADNNDHSVQLYASTDKSGKHWWLIEAPLMLSQSPVPTTAAPTDALSTSDQDHEPTSAPSTHSTETREPTVVLATSTAASETLTTATTTATVSSTSTTSDNQSAGSHQNSAFADNTVLIATVVLSVLCACLCVVGIGVVVYLRRKDRKEIQQLQEQNGATLKPKSNRLQRLGVPSESRHGDSKSGLNGYGRNVTPLPSISNANHNMPFNGHSDHDRLQLRQPVHVQALHVSTANVQLIDNPHYYNSTVTPFGIEDDIKQEEDGSDSDHDSDNDVVQMGAALVTPGGHY